MIQIKPFKAGVVQFDVQKGSYIPENLEKAVKGIQAIAAEGASLAVLPEMFSCGFDNAALLQHARKTPEILEVLSKKAKSHNMVIAGSLPEQVQDGICNTQYLFDRDGSLAGSYRKTHLFKLTGEHLFYAQGKTHKVVNTSLGPVGLMICYDMRFPELARKLTTEGALMILVSAQWPTPRKVHWQIIARARAIENQLFMVCCNRTGSDEDLDFPGCSMVIDPLGNVMADAGSKPAAVSATIDYNVLEQFRNQIPCLTDRRTDIYDA